MACKGTTSPFTFTHTSAMPSFSLVAQNEEFTSLQKVGSVTLITEAMQINAACKKASSYKCLDVDR